MHLEDLIRNKLSMTQHHQDCHVFNRMICKIERFRNYCLKRFLSNFYITFIMINTSRKFCLYFSFTFENCFFLKSRTFLKIYFCEKWLKNRKLCMSWKTFFFKNSKRIRSIEKKKKYNSNLSVWNVSIWFLINSMSNDNFFKAYVFLSFASE